LARQWNRLAADAPQLVLQPQIHMSSIKGDGLNPGVAAANRYAARKKIFERFRGLVETQARRKKTPNDSAW
jgi:hypothetical protein